jgi:hypothetical protein
MPDWSQVSDSSFSTTNINAVYYGDSTWVAVGASGKIATATNPLGPWTQNTALSGTLMDVEYNGTHWVAVGSTNILYTATTATGTWTAHGSPPFPGDVINSVFYGNGFWVVVSDNGQIATATDPTSTWTTNNGGYIAGNIIRCGMYGNGLWCTAGNNGRLKTNASNPSTQASWATDTSDFSTDIIFDMYYDSVSGNWVLVGAAGKISTSTDPQNGFTLRSSPTAIQLNNVVAGGSTWVAVGESGEVISATDPTSTWTEEDAGFSTSGINAIDYGNSKFVMVGDSGKMAVSITVPTNASEKIILNSSPMRW